MSTESSVNSQRKQCPKELVKGLAYDQCHHPLVTLILSGWGIHALWDTPVDAIPDLSDVQVIIKTRYAGQAPRVVEDQVTYPLTTAML